MTLKTVTGPSIRDALADARRLFGADVVMLQSAPAAHGHPASVTVAFDTAPMHGPRAAAPRPVAAPAVPEPGAEPAPRAYGYGAVRNMRPAVQESVAAPTSPDRPGATAAEVDALRARLAELETALAEVRAAAPAPAPRRPPVVFVGPGGSGKTSLALGLARHPALVGAARPAALIVAPETDRTADPAPLFWAAGVPVAVVHTADEVREALRTFADADLLIVDTPALPLAPGRAQPVMERLGAVLAPLGAAEVHLVVDATRSTATLSARTIGALGLRPDALALTRLDEAPGAETAWADALGLPLRLVAAGPDAADLALAAPALETPALEAPMPARPARPSRPSRPMAAAREAGLVDLQALVWTPLARTAPAEASLLVAA